MPNQQKNVDDLKGPPRVNIQLSVEAMARLREITQAEHFSNATEMARKFLMDAMSDWRRGKEVQIPSADRRACDHEECHILRHLTVKGYPGGIARGTCKFAPKEVRKRAARPQS